MEVGCEVMDERGEESWVWRIFLIDKFCVGTGLIAAAGSTPVEPSCSYSYSY